MANVGSWADIVDAITNATGDVTLNMIKDINLAAEPDYYFGVQSLDIPEGANFNLYGNGHKLINLTNDTNETGGIFRTNANVATTVTISDVEFINLILRNVALIQSQNSEDEVYVEDCGFVGNRSGTSYLFNCPMTRFTSCYFEMPWMSGGSKPQKYTSLVRNRNYSNYSTNHHAQYCWFREHYTGWNTDVSWSDQNVDSTTNSTLWSFYMIKLDGCYIDGDMTITRASSSSHSTHIPIDLVLHANRSAYTPSVMNVFDVDVTAIGNCTIADYGSWYGLYINKVYNESSELISNWEIAADTSSMNPYPLPIIGTVEEASDASWLRSQGFAI